MDGGMASTPQTTTWYACSGPVRTSALGLSTLKGIGEGSVRYNTNTNTTTAQTLIWARAARPTTAQKLGFVP